jgi:RIO-like serine/threonine protein kinase
MTVAIEEKKDPPDSHLNCACDIKPPRNGSKALVTKSMRNGREVAVKDFGRCSAVIKGLYGRPTLRREVRAYGVLQGLSGIPKCFGLEGPDRMVLEYIHGSLLRDLKRGTVEPEVFDRIDEIVKSAHARGVTFGDLHASNIIITESGDVFLIDFANAVFARNSNSPGWLARFFMNLDRYAAARMRARYLRLPRPYPTGFFGVVYRFGRGIKKLLHAGR